jgi:hypothetical protein
LQENTGFEDDVIRWKTCRRNPISGNRREMLWGEGKGAAELPALGRGQ